MTKSLFRSAAAMALVLSLFGAGCTSQTKQTSPETIRPREIESEAYYGVIKAGADRMGAGDFKVAISLFSQAIAMDPLQPAGYIYRGSAREGDGDLDGALADLKRLHDGYSEFASAYVTRGSVKLKKGDRRGAARDFDQAAALAPRNADVFVALAYAKRSSEDLDGAIAAANRALTLDPKRESAYMLRGLARKAKADYAGAMADFDQILALYPQDTTAFQNRGEVKRSMGDTEGAMADFKQAIAVFPNNSFAYNSIARIKESQGDLAGAQAAYLGSITVEPWRAVYNRFSLTLILRRRHLDEAPAGLAAAVQGWSDEWAKAIGNFLLGRITESELFTKAKAATPEKVREQQCEAFYYAGMTHLMDNDRAKARELFQKSVETGVTNFWEYQQSKAELEHLAK